MKRKIFLSFRPEFFRPILYGIKKYEYRKRFCNEDTSAYLYLSSPVREVIGIMELGKPIIMSEEILKYEKNSKIYNRIYDCLENKELYAIPIESLRLFKKPISIHEIKAVEPTFSVPQCYLNIEKFPSLVGYFNEQEMYDIEFINDHSNIYENNFGMSCKEMELTEEFVKKDKLYTTNEKYSIIKSGYINKGRK